MSGAPPPSVELMDLAKELRQRFSEVELKQLCELMGLDVDEISVETQREIQELGESRNRHRLQAAKLLARVNELEQEGAFLRRGKLADRLIPGVLAVRGNGDVASAVAEAEDIADRVLVARKAAASAAAAVVAEAQAGVEGQG